MSFDIEKYRLLPTKERPVFELAMDFRRQKSSRWENQVGSVTIGVALFAGLFTDGGAPQKIVATSISHLGQDSHPDSGLNELKDTIVGILEKHLTTGNVRLCIDKYMSHPSMERRYGKYIDLDMDKVRPREETDEDWSIINNLVYHLIKMCDTKSAVAIRKALGDAYDWDRGEDRIPDKEGAPVALLCDAPER